jgi:hypothetical protein
MHAITAVYGAILFVLLTPGLILRIPQKGSLLTASIVHAIVFAIVFYLISKLVYQYSANKKITESFKNNIRIPEFDAMTYSDLCMKINNIESELDELISYLQYRNMTNIKGNPLRVALENVRKVRKMKCNEE